jgi:probable rRNA maturation factor
MILIEPPRSPAAARRDPLNKRELEQFAASALRAGGGRGKVSVLLTGDDRIRNLNRQFRKKDVPTDVLSFPAISWDGQAANRVRDKSVGDLAISLDTAARQAESLGHPLAIEVKVLILHGVLHLAGFDHETDSGEMARLENRLRRRFDLPSGLISRSQLRGTSQGTTRRTTAPRKTRSSRP